MTLDSIFADLTPFSEYLPDGALNDATSCREMESEEDMNRTDLVAYCLARKEASEDFPFGEEVAVYKVMGKMFALIPIIANPASISLKCDPVLAVILRDTYPVVTAAYHLNKRHWINVKLDGSVSDDEIEEWIDNAYALVVNGLTRAKREQLRKMSEIL